MVTFSLITSAGLTSTVTEVNPSLGLYLLQGSLITTGSGVDVFFVAGRALTVGAGEGEGEAEGEAVGESKGDGVDDTRGEVASGIAETSAFSSFACLKCRPFLKLRTAPPIIPARIAIKTSNISGECPLCTVSILAIIC